MKTYIKLFDRNYNSTILNNTDIVARQTKTTRALIVPYSSCNELLDLNSTKEVVFMSEEQFVKYNEGLHCVSIVDKKQITLFTKKGTFEAYKYIDKNGNEVNNFEDYRLVQINGRDYKCSKLENSEYNYNELYEFSDTVTKSE